MTETHIEQSTFELIALEESFNNDDDGCVICEECWEVYPPPGTKTVAVCGRLGFFNGLIVDVVECEDCKNATQCTNGHDQRCEHENY